MAKNIFNELHFDVDKNIFYEVLENQDKGFGFRATLKFKHLTELQVDVLNFLIRCQKKNLLGSVTIIFRTNAIGEVNPTSRRVERIIKVKDAFVIANSY